MKDTKNKFLKGNGRWIFIVAAGGIFLIVLMLFIFSLIANKSKTSQGETLLKTEATEEQITEEDFHAKEEILTADTFSNQIQFGIPVIELPCTFEEMIHAGAVISDEKYSLDYLVDGESEITIALDLYGEELNATIRNPGQEIVKAGECTVECIEDINSQLITFPGGIQADISTYDDVKSIWGEGHEITTRQDTSDKENGSTFTYYYYRDGIAYKDVYAYKLDKKKASSADIIDVGGYKYALTFDRGTGIITNVDVCFSKKSGIDTWQQLSYVCDGGTVAFEVLEDANIVSEKDKIAYCTEEIGGRTYIIGVGMTNSCFDASGSLLDDMKDLKAEDNEAVMEESVTEALESTEQQEEPEIKYPANELMEEYLQYGNYDFSENYEESGGNKNWHSYSGESVKEGIYFAIDAEIHKKYACSIAFYMHPLDSNEHISQDAREFMENYREHVKSTLYFVD